MENLAALSAPDVLDVVTADSQRCHHEGLEPPEMLTEQLSLGAQGVAGAEIPS